MSPIPGSWASDRSAHLSTEPMAFAKLAQHVKAMEEARVAAETTAAEKEARLALQRAVKAVLPKRLRVPTRPRGRTPSGGIGRREVASLRAKATRYLDGEAGMHELEADVQHTALVILLIDGVIGTEPWRAAHAPHGGLMAANARLRYLENAARLLDDLRRSREGQAEVKGLLEGVLDAESAG